MSDEVRQISLKNLGDAVRIMNESTRSTSHECHLDMFSFMSLWQYWNFSNQHSLIHYLDGEPAAIVLTCTNPSTREAYTFYWGAIPKFRNRRISMPLLNACCEKLRQDGYLIIHGDSSPDRPAKRYRFVDAMPALAMSDLRAETFHLPSKAPDIETCKRDVDILALLTSPPEGPVHWTQQFSFLRQTTSFLNFIGAFRGHELVAYAAVHPKESGTTIVDIRSPENSQAAGFELLRFLHAEKYPAPYTAVYVFDSSYSHSLLSEAGFISAKQYFSLSRVLQEISAHPPAI